MQTPVEGTREAPRGPDKPVKKVDGGDHTVWAMAVFWVIFITGMIGSGTRKAFPHAGMLGTAMDLDLQRGAWPAVEGRLYSHMVACMMSPAIGVLLGVGGSHTAHKAVSMYAGVVSLCACCGCLALSAADWSVEASWGHSTYVLEKGLTLIGLLASSVYTGVMCVQWGMPYGLVSCSVLLQTGLALLGVAIQDPVEVLLAWGVVVAGTLACSASAVLKVPPGFRV